MNYLDVYHSRVNHFGETYVDRLKNSGIVAFEKWKARSPFLIEDLSVERGFYFSGIIETSKDKEEKKLMYLYVANDIPIVVGDILTWRQDDGAIEKWLLLQKIHKVHEAYQTFQIIKCNYNLKWIDTKGYLHQSWAYAVSSVDSKVKGNFRMWHSLISPQPNKFAEIIMPRPELADGDDRNQLMRGITFIIEDEGWEVIECDWTSVEGVVYMSLTESKVNYEYDNREIEVAATDRYKFPELSIQYKAGDKIIPHFDTNTLNQWEIEMRPSNFDLVTEQKEGETETPLWYSELHSNGVTGTCIVTMRLKSNPAVTRDVEITIYPQEDKAMIYIEGPDELRLDRYGTYELRNKTDNSKVTMEVQFPSETNEKISDYVTLTQDDKDKEKYILHANKKNKIGKVVLVASYNGQQYTKTVSIIPLW